MSLIDAPLEGASLGQQVQRLLVSRQDGTRMYRPIGFLETSTAEDGMVEYSFAYLRSAVEAEDFRPFLGFREIRRHTSRGLFPLFAERLMDSRRPDRPAFLAALALDEEATPLTVLSRSGGQRHGDGIELSPIPVADGQGRTSCVFLVHGVRHRDGAQERIDSLQTGDLLSLRDDRDNPVNPDAMHVAIADADGTEVGWVPDVLLTYVRQLENAELRVEQVNPREAGPQLRLLVRIQGDAAPGWSPFEGEGWETVN
ncbi:hypothetical protein [Quadrisphaera sp. INWT6]|uniref:hypothetical protein n=1 Tax=Quadrisphaera sp. INWT6 TaxID=2596917 RepID=UPI0018922660|nr:hypothetical protein [Quadrisphaera sp. INWT6]MBF5080772.1 hypothetical protein [Quadrisphaera sp. INWT6]